VAVLGATERDGNVDVVREDSQESGAAAVPCPAGVSRAMAQSEEGGAMSLNQWFEELASSTDLAAREAPVPASSCLKSKVYSALILAMEEDGPLLPCPKRNRPAGRFASLNTSWKFCPLQTPCRVCSTAKCAMPRRWENVLNTPRSTGRAAPTASSRIARIASGTRRYFGNRLAPARRAVAVAC